MRPHPVPNAFVDPAAADPAVADPAADGAAADGAAVDRASADGAAADGAAVGGALAPPRIPELWVRAEPEGPPGLLRRFVDGLEPMMAEIQQRLVEVAPDYASFLAQHKAEVVDAVEPGMRRLLRLAADLQAGSVDPEVVTEPELQRALFEEMGRVQWREGREMRTLLAAYQEGARVAWRHLSRAARQDGMDGEHLAALAEAVLLLVDQLSTASVEGYLQQQSEAAATRERLREELADLLLSDRSDTAVVQTAAARAGWRLPRMAAVVFVDPAEPSAALVMSRLDQSCLQLRRPRLLGAIIPDPPERARRERLTERLKGAGAVVGPIVPVRDLPASVHIAELTAVLRRNGVLSGDPLFVDDHLDTLIVWRDPALLERLQQQCLAPLDDLPAAARERLVDTLRAWLRHSGDRRAVAEELHVHPQTVRYRMGQLQDRFGGALTEPQARSRLMLALGWSRPS